MIISSSAVFAKMTGEVETESSFEKNRIKICVLDVGRQAIEFVTDYENDKAQHCTVSCLVAYNCGEVASFWLGALKEFEDIFTSGNADWKDMRANSMGIAFSSMIEDETECMELCLYAY